MCMNHICIQRCIFSLALPLSLSPSLPLYFSLSLSLPVFLSLSLCLSPFSLSRDLFFITNTLTSVSPPLLLPSPWLTLTTLTGPGVL